MVIPYQLHALHGSDGHLASVEVATLKGETRHLPADVLLPFFGLSMDLGPIAASLRRTGRAVVAHEAVRTGGFGAELAAQLQDAAFDYLEAPIQRVGAPFAPVPLSPTLEDAYRPDADDVYAAARLAMKWADVVEPVPVSDPLQA